MGLRLSLSGEWQTVCLLYLLAERVPALYPLPLQTVRAAWLDTYYDDNEQPTGWDEDPEDDVDDIDALPEWPDFDSDSD